MSLYEHCIFDSIDICNQLFFWNQGWVDTKFNTMFCTACNTEVFNTEAKIFCVFDILCGNFTNPFGIDFVKL